jgi:hypothetical protein
MISVGWLKSEDQDWPQWVQNRVTQLNESKAGIKFCPGIENPADIPSWGTTVKEMNHTKCWNGPDWLTDKEKPVDHPVEIDKVKATADAKITHVNTTKIDRTKLRFCVKDVSELDTAVLRQSMITIGVNLILKKLARPTTQTVKFKNK